MLLSLHHHSSILIYADKGSFSSGRIWLMPQVWPVGGPCFVRQKKWLPTAKRWWSLWWLMTIPTQMEPFLPIQTGMIMQFHALQHIISSNKTPVLLWLPQVPPPTPLKAAVVVESTNIPTGHPFGPNPLLDTSATTKTKKFGDSNVGTAFGIERRVPARNKLVQYRLTSMQKTIWHRHKNY